MDFQTALVIIIAALAVFFLTRKYFLAAKRGGCGCGCGGGCSADKNREGEGHQ